MTSYATRQNERAAIAAFTATATRIVRPARKGARAHVQYVHVAAHAGLQGALPLQPGTVRKLATMRKVRAAATAGLRELAAAQLPTVHRSTYQSDADFAAELLAMRCDVADGMPVAVALPLHNFATRAFA